MTVLVSYHSGSRLANHQPCPKSSKSLVIYPCPNPTESMCQLPGSSRLPVVTIFKNTGPARPIEKMIRFLRKLTRSFFFLKRTFTPNFSSLSLAVRPRAPIEIFKESAGRGAAVGGGRGSARVGHLGRCLSTRLFENQRTDYHEIWCAVLSL